VRRNVSASSNLLDPDGPAFADAHIIHRPYVRTGRCVSHYHPRANRTDSERIDATKSAMSRLNGIPHL
jgi:hypothetical protein